MNSMIKLSLLILVIALSGCAGNLKNIGKSPINASKLESVNYGSDLKTINKIINHTGIPLFKFYNNHKNYYITFYRPSHYEQSYLFFYENNLLVSVVETEKGLKIWEDNFGTYKQSIPVEKHFSRVISSFKKHAIQIVPHFITNNEYIIDPSDFTIRRDGSGDVSAQLLIVGSTWGLAWFPYFMTASTIANIIEDPIVKDISSFLEIKSNNYYENILNKYGGFNFGTTINDVVSILGNPDNRDAKDSTKILIYKSDQAIIYGFSNNKLQWIAFDYPVEIKK